MKNITVELINKFIFRDRDRAVRKVLHSQDGESSDEPISKDELLRVNSFLVYHLEDFIDALRMRQFFVADGHLREDLILTIHAVSDLAMNRRLTKLLCIMFHNSETGMFDVDKFEESCMNRRNFGLNLKAGNNSILDVL